MPRLRVRPAVAASVLAAALCVVVAVGGRDAAAVVPAPYGHFTNGTVVWESGSNVVVWANALPNHGSPYFYPTDPLWEPYNGTNPNFQLNPNHIGTQGLQFTMPENPQAATVHQATPLGPIGVAINGVPFFNQYAGRGSSTAADCGQAGRVEALEALFARGWLMDLLV